MLLYLVEFVLCTVNSIFLKLLLFKRMSSLFKIAEEHSAITYQMRITTDKECETL